MSGEKCNNVIGCTLATLDVEGKNGVGWGVSVVCVNGEREILKCEYVHSPQLSCSLRCLAMAPVRVVLSPPVCPFYGRLAPTVMGVRGRGRPWLGQPPMLGAQQEEEEEEDDGALFSPHPPHHRERHSMTCVAHSCRQRALLLPMRRRLQMFKRDGRM